MSSENTVKAIAIGCVSIIVVGFISLCGLGVWFLNSYLKRPPTRPGFGIVRREGTNGLWTTYWIPDCDLRLELKGDPYPKTARMSEWERTHLSTFSRYLCTTKMDLIIFDAECKTADPANLGNFTEMFEHGVIHDPSVIDYQPRESDIEVGTHHGKLVKATYRYQGRRMLTAFLFLSEGRRILALRGTGTPPAKGGASNWDHMLKSVVWTPR